MCFGGRAPQAQLSSKCCSWRPHLIARDLGLLPTLHELLMSWQPVWHITAIANGTPTSNSIEVADIGTIQINGLTPNTSLIYFTNPDNTCNDNPRFSIVEVFEDLEPFHIYYICNVTIGLTQNDPANISYFSDSMALMASASIAQNGYPDADGQQHQIYPSKDYYGVPPNGSAAEKKAQSRVVWAWRYCDRVVLQPCCVSCFGRPYSGFSAVDGTSQGVQTDIDFNLHVSYAVLCHRCGVGK